MDLRVTNTLTVIDTPQWGVPNVAASGLGQPQHKTNPPALYVSLEKKVVCHNYPKLIRYSPYFMHFISLNARYTQYSIAVKDNCAWIHISKHWLHKLRGFPVFPICALCMTLLLRNP